MKKQHIRWIGLGMLILGALILRTYQLDLTRFEHEMVRDVLAAREVLEGDPKLHGFFASPISTLQTTFGPATYYLMALGTLLMGKSMYWMPLGTILMIAVLDALAVLIVYRIGKEFFSEKIGWISAALYAVSPWMILHVATISSPTNFMPFFASVYTYCICKVIIKKQDKWIIPAAVAFAFMTHIHLTSLLVVPGTFIAWWIVAKKWDQRKIPWRQIGLGVAAILLLSMPFLYYSMKENNFDDTIEHMVGKRVSANRLVTGLEAVGIPFMISMPYFGKYLLGEETRITTKSMEWYFLGITWILILIVFITMFMITHNGLYRKREIMVILVLFATPIILYTVKGSSITVHYFLMMLPLPMIILAIGIEDLMKHLKKTMNVLIIVVFLSNILVVVLFYNAVAEQGGTTGIYGITYREKVNTAKYVVAGLEKKEEPIVYFYRTQKPLRESITYLLNLHGGKQYTIKTIDNIEEAENGYLLIDRESFYGTYSGEGVPKEDYESIEKMNPIKFKMMEVIEV